jgi:fucose 4-O-acetylase-like acetyltransferase
LASQRNIHLDLMRFLGILVIMIGHAGPPDWLFQLRNFGTPLLIVASALTYATIYATRPLDISSFYQKRLTRLIVPAWFFLTFFFLFFLVAAQFTGKDYPFSFKDILGSYTFYDGIGYVWILKVYVMLALLTPVALKITNLKISNTAYFSCLVILYAVYEGGLRVLAPVIPSSLAGFFNTVIFVVVPYSILYLYGTRLASLTNKEIAVAVAVSLVIFIALVIAKYSDAGYFVPTQKFKYPPTIYYLSYSFFALNLIYLACKYFSQFAKTSGAAILWLASNSLWIYLWHIMAYYLLFFSVGDDDKRFFVFFARVSFILVFSVVLTYIQTLVVRKFVSADHYLGRKAIAVLT